MKIRISFLFTLMLPLAVMGQEYHLSNQIQVSDLIGKDLPHAWSGGMHNPQPSAIDLNQDGYDDLVVFDRIDNHFTTYLYTGQGGTDGYVLAPQYQSNFDSCGCITWAVIQDYNCDGQADIFCGNNQGNILVYQNVLYNGDSVGFELAFDPLYSQSFNFIPLYVPKSDIPAIFDIDFDGDMDIVAPQNGFNTLAFHKNLAMERYGRCDTLDMDKESSCWGHFIEASNTNTLVLGDTTFGCAIPSGLPSECIPGRSAGPDDPIRDPQSNPRHAGTTLLCLDLNADDLFDIMLGDITYAEVTTAYNYGCIDHAWMDSVETFYPHADSAISVGIFPGMFYFDLDKDGVKDLLVAPNTTTDGESVNGLVWYKNEGQDNLVDFRFQGRSFIASEQIDLGTYSSPAFFDFNDDGLMDMLVGSDEGKYWLGDTMIIRQNMHLYLNEGDSDIARFVLADSNFLDLGGLGLSLKNLSPVFADLNNDQDEDLILGAQDGQLYYFENTSGLGQEDVFMAPAGPLMDANNELIDVGGLSAPELYDFDGDGDRDLFIGEAYGWINYYENTGSASAFSFTMVSDSFGSIKLSDQYGSQFSGNSKPRILDYDGDNEAELIVGGEQGFLEVYDGIENGLVSGLILKEYLFDHDFGSFSAPAAAILDSTNELSYVVGNFRGGLQLVNQLEEDTNSVSIQPPLDNAFKLFPNPANHILWLEFNELPGTYAQVRMINMMGQELYRSAVSSKRHAIAIQSFARGIYLVKVEIGGKEWTEKVILR